MQRARVAAAVLVLLLAASARAQEVELRWSRPRAFVHEQVLLDAVVMHPVALNPRWEAPPFDGFVVERLASEGSTMRRDATGSYVRTTRLRHALFPTRAGVIEIAPSRILFQDGSGRETSLALPGTRLAVENLPEAGRPVGFDTTVGTLGVRATLTPSTIALGEHASLELDVFGVANVWDVAPPDLEAALGAACEIFAERPQVDRGVRDEQLFARKTFRFSLVPGAQGRIAIPALRFPHFDPERSAYRVASTEPLELEVGPARAPGALPSARAEPEPAPGTSGGAWLPTALVVANGLGVALGLRRRPRASPQAAQPAPEPARGLDPAALQELLQHAEASLEEPSFGALLSRALRSTCAGDASLTSSELAARIQDPELAALLRAIDVERFSRHPSLAQRRTLLDSAAAYVRARRAASYV
jgi:hypothetical protein